MYAHDRIAYSLMRFVPHPHSNGRTDGISKLLNPPQPVDLHSKTGNLNYCSIGR